MLRRRPHTAFTIAIVAILVVTRLAGGHMHLCFDGNEPAVSLHAIEVERHHDDGARHEDRDVDLPGFTLAKAKSGQGGELFIAPAAMSWSVPEAAVSAAPGVAPRFHPDGPAYLRPPARGPPASLPA